MHKPRRPETSITVCQKVDQLCLSNAIRYYFMKGGLCPKDSLGEKPGILCDVEA
jgi:hypothetical protein